MKRMLTFSLMVCLGAAAVRAADWPQWQGPDRARISKETGLLKEWPKDGPSVVSTANNLGTGYGRFYVRTQDTLLVYDVKAK
jgi:outer membrane protein assembly factor BamB